MHSSFRKLLWLAVFVIIFVTKNAASSENNAARKTINVGYIEFPPVFYTNQQGKAAGSLIRLTRKVLENAGFQMQAHTYPTNRMIKQITQGKIDLWVGLATIPQFTGNTLIGESEVMEITLQSYSIGNKSSINTQQDLNEKNIIILRGYSYGGWINYIKDPANNVHFLEVDSHEKALELLSRGRADYLLDYKGPTTLALQKMPIENISANKISSFAAHFVVSKAIKKPAQLLKRIEKSYRQLRDQGKL